MSKTGRSLDDVTQALHEQGWLGTPGGDRPAISDLLSAIYDDQHGSPRLHPNDTAAVEYSQHLKALDNTLYEHGVDLRTTSNADAERVLNGQSADRGPATLADHDAQDARFAQAARYASGETPLPEQAAASRLAETATKAAPAMDEEISHLDDGVRAAQASGALPASIPELDAANAGVDRAAGAKRAYEQAASCLARGGA